MFDERGDLWNMVDKRVNTLVRPVPAAGGRAGGLFSIHQQDFSSCFPWQESRLFISTVRDLSLQTKDDRSAAAITTTTHTAPTERPEQ